MGRSREDVMSLIPRCRHAAATTKAIAVTVLIGLCATGCGGDQGGGCDRIRGTAEQAAERARSADVAAMKETAARAARTAKEGAAIAADIAKAFQVPERVRSGRNLRRIAVAVRAYHDAHGCFPPAATRDAQGRELLSWRVLILPHLGPEEAALYRDFQLNEPWDGEHNRQLLTRMPNVFAPPAVDTASTRPTSGPASRPAGHPRETATPGADYAKANVTAGTAAAAAGLTYYKVFTGKGTAFEDGRRVTFKDIADDPFFTFLAVEAPEPSPWTKPEDLVYAPSQRPPTLGFMDGWFLSVDFAGVVLYHNRDGLEWFYVTIAGGEVPPPSGGGGSGVFDFD